MGMDQRFWDGTRWNGHRAFNTMAHHHVSCYEPAPGHDTCDIMIVGCADGRWYVEDNWGDDVGGDKVWNPFDKSDAGPHFFPNEDEAMKYAVAVVAKVSGVPESEVGSI